MKKLFVSCPMNGLTKEEIIKRIHILHKLAELHLEEEFELLNTWVEEEPIDECVNNKLWYAGKSLEILSKADHYVGVRMDTCLRKKYFGCYIENEAADKTGIPSLLFNIDLINPTRKEKSDD